MAESDPQSLYSLPPVERRRIVPVEGAAIPQPSVVDSAEAITPDWMTAVFRRSGRDWRVRSVSAQAVGTGQMAHNERIRLEYEDPDGAAAAGAPASVVAKLASPNEESRAAGGAGAYAAEVRFYLNVADRLTMRVPACYYGALSDDGTRFVLVLEDMAPAEQGDQIAGASDPQIADSVRSLAGLHAPMWDAKDLQGVPQTSMQLDASVAPDLVLASAAFIDRYADVLSSEAKHVFSEFAKGFARWVESEPAPATLVHGDYRLDNQLFATDDRGPRVTTVDWQTISLGNGGRDLAYMLGNACPPDQRARGEAEWLEIYREEMSRQGVALDGETVRHAYRHGSFQGPLITMLGALGVGRTERGDAMFMAMADRSAAQILENDALALVR